MSKTFGLDIGSNQVKAIQVLEKDNFFLVTNLAAVEIGSQELSQAIRAAIKEAGINPNNEVNLALQESEVFTRIIKTPKLSEAELASSIQYEAEQYIPMALSEVELYHQILPQNMALDEKTIQVLLIAVPKQRVEEITSILDKAELLPHSIETEMFALKRLYGNDKKIQILLSFGHKTTDMMVLKQNAPLFTHSISIGALSLTKKLMNDLNLAPEQAEAYKRTYGLKKELIEGKVAEVLFPAIDEIIVQINKALIFLQQQGLNRQADEVIICGGGSLLPGLSAYLASKLNLEVSVGDPFKNFIKDERFKKLVTSEVNPQWSTAVGLAIK